MKKYLFFSTVVMFLLGGCDYWPSHYFYVHNAMDESEIVLIMNNSGYTSSGIENENRINSTMQYAIPHSETKLIRIVGSGNTGRKYLATNVFDEYFPDEIVFTVYINGIEIHKTFYNKEFWQFTAYKGYGDYLLTIDEELIK